MSNVLEFWIKTGGRFLAIVGALTQQPFNKETSHMKINRKLQNEMLQQLENVHPDELEDIEDFDLEIEDKKVRLSNAVYLKEHKLIKYKDASTIEGFDIHSIRITSRGRDFLMQDGGLSAILDVVTIKLHTDTLKELISKEITHSDLSNEHKQKYLDQLQSLPAESTKHLVNTLVEEGVKAGFRAGPQAAQWLQTLLQSL